MTKLFNFHIKTYNFYILKFWSKVHIRETKRIKKWFFGILNFSFAFLIEKKSLNFPKNWKHQQSLSYYFGGAFENLAPIDIPSQQSMCENVGNFQVQVFSILWFLCLSYKLRMIHPHALPFPTRPPSIPDSELVCYCLPLFLSGFRILAVTLAVLLVEPVK